MTMFIDSEIFLIFYTAIFFTLLTVFVKQIATRIVLSAVSFLSWIVLAIAFNSTNPSLQGVSFLFFGIGFAFLIIVIVDSIGSWGQIKKLSKESQ